MLLKGAVIKSKHLLPISNNEVRLINAGVYPYLRRSIWGTLFDGNCLYSETRVMLKLGRRARGHFVTLIKGKGKR